MQVECTATTTNSRQLTPTPAEGIPWRHFSSDFASMWLIFGLTQLVAHPVDTVRMRWQATNRTPLVVLRQDGFRSLYAGFNTPIVTLGPVVSLLFALNEFYRGLYRSWMGTSAHLPGQWDSHRTAEVAIAGAACGVTSTIVLTPALVVKGQQQVMGRGGATVMSGPNVLKHLYATEGIRGPYRALPLDVLVGGIGRSIYFYTFEKLKHVMEFGFDDRHGQVRSSGPLVESDVARRFIAATSTSVWWWFCVHPIELTKNLVMTAPMATAGAPQRQFLPFFDGIVRRTVNHVYKASGFTGFWRGYPLTAARSFVSSGLCLPMFDYMKPRARDQTDIIFSTWCE